MAHDDGSIDDLANALAGLNLTGAVPDDVREVVTGFIAAHHEWEVDAYATCDADSPQENWDDAKDKYDQMIRNWCAPEVEPQAISFGSDPNHDPANERIVGGVGDQNTYRVKSTTTNFGGFEDEYEYHLRLCKGRWKIVHLYVVIDGRRIECL